MMTPGKTKIGTPIGAEPVKNGTMTPLAPFATNGQEFLRHALRHADSITLQYAGIGKIKVPASTETIANPFTQLSPD